MNLDQVYEKAKGKDVALVKEGPVFFLVLNRPDNNLDFEFMEAVDACLNEVEQSTGAACLVTIG